MRKEREKGREGGEEERGGEEGRREERGKGRRGTY